MAESRLARLIGEATVLAACTMFSYFVYLMGERGYLHAFGLQGIDATIPITLQDLIPTVVILLVVTVSAVIYMVVAMRLATGLEESALVRRLPWLLKPTQAVMLAVILAMVTLPLLVMLVYMDKIMFLVILAALALIVWQSHPSRLFGLDDPPGRPSPFESGGIWLAGHLEKYVPHWLARALIFAGVLVILLCPAYAFSLGYVQARSQTLVYELRDGKTQYIVARQYSDRIVLVELQGNRVLPHYQVERMKDDSRLNLSLVRIKQLDFSAIPTDDNLEIPPIHWPHWHITWPRLPLR